MKVPGWKNVSRPRARWRRCRHASGNRNVEFGPQLTSSLRSTRLSRMRLRSTVATRSPIQPTSSRDGSYAHTLRLYGNMNVSQSPVPKAASSQSRNDAGAAAARRSLQVEEAVQARDQLVVRQPPDVVLKGIRNPAIAHPDPGFANVLDPRVAERRIHHLVKVLVVREQHVAAKVPGESMRVDHG